MLLRRPRGLEVCAAPLALLAAPWLACAADFCISGTVVNASTGEPLRHAAATIPQAATLTDAAGIFRFCGLPAGAYYANAEKPGFTAAGTQVVIGPSRENILLRLQPLAVIKGKVTESGGEPLEKVLIQALSITTEDGRRKVKVESAVSTDDRGEYRLPGMAAGPYLLRAAGWQGAASGAKSSDSGETFAAVYYGGATDLASAAPLAVAAGSQLDADFSVTLAPSYRIRGVLAGFSALLPPKIELLGPEGDLSAAPVAFSPATGVFQISNVASLINNTPATESEGEESRRGEQAVQVGSTDVNDVLLTLAGTVTLKGAVRVAGASVSSPLPPACSVDVSPAGDSMSQETAVESSTSDDGEFEVPSLLPGRYRVKMECANGYIAAAHFGDADLLARDELLIIPGAPPPRLEAVLNRDGGTLDLAEDTDKEPVTAWLALVPDSGNDLHTRFAILKGKLSLSGIAPGDYHVYAWVGSPYEFEYANPEAQRAWAGRAVSVHVAERVHQSVSLKIAPREPQ